MSEFERSMRQTLRASEQTLDNATLAELSERRRQALSAPSKRRLPIFLAPAIGMAAAAVLALLVINPFTPTDNNVTQDDYLTGNIELYEELDFYSWLAYEERSVEG